MNESVSYELVQRLGGLLQACHMQVVTACKPSSTFISN